MLATRWLTCLAGTGVSPAGIIDKVNPSDKKFDEHKVVIGPKTSEQAKREYLKSYEKGWQGAGEITEMPMDQFKSWVMDKSKTQRPASKSANSVTDVLTSEEKHRLALRNIKIHQEYIVEGETIKTVVDADVAEKLIIARLDELKALKDCLRG